MPMIESLLKEHRKLYSLFETEYLKFSKNDYFCQSNSSKQHISLKF